ncbi:MAG: dihydroorotate dehydrogenase electron transfer subunit [Bacillota bacterium]|nr:dihydroorotate dehydrogenase electron transfer subunit [Bacillota bacterium]
MDTGRLEQTALVLTNVRLSPVAVLLELRLPEMAAAARPGQFVMLANRRSYLRRPLAICGVNHDRRSLSVAMEAKGAGTRDLMELAHGDRITVLGPLGRGWRFSDFDAVIAVGGGTGVYALPTLLEAAQAARQNTICVLGFRERSRLVLEDRFRAAADTLLLVSELGGLDVTGNVLDGLRALDPRLLQRHAPERTLVACCGPAPMMRAVADWAAQQGFACQVSLEERMACGFGVCRTCACRVRTDDGWTYERVCHEGPVFDAADVIWEEDGDACEA